MQFLCGFLTFLALFALTPVLAWAQLWTATYGGMGHDGAHSVRETSDGGFIVAGHTGWAGVRQGDIWLLKLNAQGNIPSCDLSINPSGAPHNTSISPKDTSVTPSSGLEPVESAATPADTDALTEQQCLAAAVIRGSVFDKKTGDRINKAKVNAAREETGRTVNPAVA
jgi:hypothetical protein